MKDINDVERVLLKELNNWFTKQCKNPYKRFYLMYRPSGPNKPGKLLISNVEAQKLGKEYKYACHERINASKTKLENFQVLKEYIRAIPILDYD